MLSLSNFVLFWVFIELLILFFIGLAYSTTLNSFSYLIIYFLIQSYSSFSILIFYLLSSEILLTFSFLLKLCMFPFHSWFIPVGYRLNNFILFLSSTLHKLPAFLIILIFQVKLSSPTLEFSALLSIMVSSVTMFVSDLRLLVVCSSIGNNSWFLLSSFCNYSTFFIFFLFYSASLFLLFYSWNSLNKPTVYSNTIGCFYLLSLSGLPPFPIFFVKILIVYQLVFTSPSTFLFLLLFINSFIMSAYLYYCLVSLVFYFSVDSNIFMVH